MRILEAAFVYKTDAMERSIRILRWRCFFSRSSVQLLAQENGQGQDATPVRRQAGLHRSLKESSLFSPVVHLEYTFNWRDKALLCRGKLDWAASEADSRTTAPQYRYRQNGEETPGSWTDVSIKVRVVLFSSHPVLSELSALQP